MRLGIRVFGTPRTTGGREERLADLGEHALRIALAELHPDKSQDWARKVIETIKHRKSKTS